MMITMMAIMPFYAIFQGIVLTYIRSAWTITYLRLIKPPVDAGPTSVENA